jgi:signal transduction histidine kinase
MSAAKPVNNLLQLAEGRILVEQLRLLLGHVTGLVVIACTLFILMAWILTNDNNKFLLWTWCALAILSRLNLGAHARRHLKAGISTDHAHGLVWSLIALQIIDGVVMGSLAWITLDSSTVAGSILVIAVLSGSLGSAMSQLSPVLPVFITKATIILAMLSSKLWLMDNSNYKGLGFVGILYLISIITQGRDSSRATHQAIELRFENLALLEKLQVETENAQAAHQKAEAARQEAELANAAKSKFLAAVSHDLRQPIHAQGLFLGALSLTKLDAHQQDILTNASAASKSSVSMLNTLLDFSRIEAGVVKPNLQSFNLQPLFNKIEREFVSQADEKGISYRSRETTLIVHSDPMLVELILRNFVSNAIRYTEHGGILVVCRKRGETAVLEVWDTGIGIDVADQEIVFREFLQLANPERDRQNGLGLGLSIAQGLARALNLNLSLSSTLHKGSVFRLFLPIAIEQAVKEHRVEDTPKLFINLRVLVIDDDEIVQKGMQTLLRDWGCECHVAGSIEEAIERAQLQTPDLVICDYRLREHRTGIEAIQTLRGLLGDALPALLITGDTGPDRLRDSLDSGIPLLHKPVTPNLLYQSVVNIVRKRKQPNERELGNVVPRKGSVPSIEKLVKS